MKTTRMTSVALVALMMFLGLGLADQAQAGVRVEARVRTPHFGIVIGNGPEIYRTERYRPIPVRGRYQVPLTKRDKRIARRLSRYLDLDRRELLRAKRMGYTWREIGRWYGIPSRVMRAAMNQRSWDRFLSHRSCCDSHKRGRGHRGYGNGCRN